MDFFTHQEAARKRTSLLLFYYAMAVGLLVLSTYGAALITFGGKSHASLWNPTLFLGSVVGTLSVVAIGTLWQTMRLQQGGSAVAEMLGGTLLDPDPASAEDRQLRNVIEEMAIAAGVPVPQIYVLEQEHGINAFAAGHSPADAAIGVTRGCVRQLNRDELQGVMAHEFSHILNGDMRLNMRLMGVLHGILCLYIIGRVLMYLRSDSRQRGNNPLPLFGLLLIAIGGLGVLFGRLIQAAVSRQREFLADASAVQFTRNPQGMASALKKIGGVVDGSKLQTPRAASASHLFFGNGMAESWFGLMATHPPLEERIRRIDPSFDGVFPTVSEEYATEDNGAGNFMPPVIGAAGFSGRSTPPPPLRVSARRMVQQVGEPVNVSYAVELLGSLPVELREASRHPASAVALLHALVLNHEAGARRAQLASTTLHPDLAARADAFAAQIAQLDPRVRLPLLNLCLPTLRTLSPSEWPQHRDTLEELIQADGQMDLFEFMVVKVVAHQIEAWFHPAQSGVVQFYSFNAVATDCTVLLSALAWAGSEDASDAQLAFEAGAARLPLRESLPLLPPAECGLPAIDTALDHLAQSIPHIKKMALEAGAHTVAHDGFIHASEAELLRALADTLGCPIPPFVEGV